MYYYFRNLFSTFISPSHFHHHFHFIIHYSVALGIRILQHDHMSISPSFHIIQYHLCMFVHGFDDWMILLIVMNSLVMPAYFLYAALAWGFSRFDCIGGSVVHRKMTPFPFLHHFFTPLIGPTRPLNSLYHFLRIMFKNPEIDLPLSTVSIWLRMGVVTTFCWGEVGCSELPKELKLEQP